MPNILKLAKECFSPRSMLCKFQVKHVNFQGKSSQVELAGQSCFKQTHLLSHEYVYMCAVDRMTTLDDDVKLSMAYQSRADHSGPRFWHVLTQGWRKRPLQWMRSSDYCTICTFSPAPGWHTQVQLWIDKGGSLFPTVKRACKKGLQLFWSPTCLISYHWQCCWKSNIEELWRGGFEKSEKENGRKRGNERSSDWALYPALLGLCHMGPHWQHPGSIPFFKQKYLISTHLIATET